MFEAGKKELRGEPVPLSGFFDELHLLRSLFYLLVDIHAQLCKVVGEGLESGLHIGAVLLSFAPGIHSDTAGRGEVDLGPVLHGFELARGYGMADDPEPERAQHPVDEQGLAVGESAVCLGHCEANARAGQLRGIGGKLEGQHAQRGVAAQVLKKAREGRTRAGTLKGFQILAGLDFDELATQYALEPSGVRAFRFRCASQLEVSIVCRIAGGGENTRDVRMVLHGVLFEGQQLHLIEYVID